jgi:signal transduction histidine kinase
MTHQRDDHCARLLSLAVHEFRTPTAVVSGYLRMVLRHFGEGLSDQQRKLLEESEKACGTLSRLLSDFSDLARLEHGGPPLTRERLSLQALLGQVASNVHEGSDRGVTVEVDANEGLVVEADRARLGEAMGSLMAAVVRERLEGARVVAVARANGDPPSALVAFGDVETASGLLDDPAVLSRPFDEYRGGLGFRLPAAARVIEAHGGRLASPNEERGRLSIVMTLPAAVGRAENAG